MTSIISPVAGCDDRLLTRQGLLVVAVAPILHLWTVQSMQY